jgi:hypothetical protein
MGGRRLSIETSFEWKFIAEEYSRRELTFVEDQFVAIAAVAKEQLTGQGGK